MKVIVNEKEYDYESDYPTGWKFIAKDFFKFPVTIGKHPCFIKRFDTGRSGEVYGWNLLEKLKYKNEQNLPRIYDIVPVDENRKQVKYVFYEYVKGITLDVLLAEGMDGNRNTVNLEQLTNDLLLAFESIHKHDFWFADFCEKNIISADKEKFFLIDVDSCQPVSQPPDNGMHVNMLYWALVFKFYKEELQVKEIKPSDISGIALNYLQLIFLIVHLKLRSVDKDYEYLSDASFNNLPVILNNIDPAFSELFSKALYGGKHLQDVCSAGEVKKLLFEKIIIPDIPVTAHHQGAEKIQSAHSFEPISEPEHTDKFLHEEDHVNNSISNIEDISTTKACSTEETRNEEENSSQQQEAAGMVLDNEKDIAEKKILPFTVNEKAYRKPLVERLVFRVIAAVCVAGIITLVSLSGRNHSHASKNSNRIQEPAATAAAIKKEPKAEPVNDSFTNVAAAPVNEKIQPATTNNNRLAKEAQQPVKKVLPVTAIQPQTKSNILLNKAEQDASDEPRLVKMCQAICHTKGITGIEVSFTLKKINKTFNVISGSNDLVFTIPCDMLEESVSVTFKGNGQTDDRNFKLKEFEIPEMFKK